MPMLISPRRIDSTSSCGVAASCTGFTTPVATMSITSAREADVRDWSAMPADRSRRFVLMA